MKKVIIEACVTTLEEALNAQAAGANRIELCEHIEADGLTPNQDLIRSCLDALDIPVKILIRPREGNFVYNVMEITQMETSILFCKTIGIEEVVIGALLPNNKLDLTLISSLAALAAPMKVCIHKAIDDTPDLIEATMSLCTVDHVTGILSSGGQPKAIDGATTIKKMIAASEGKLEIIAAGKITADNLESHQQLIDGIAYHGRRIVRI